SGGAGGEEAEGGRGGTNPPGPTNPAGSEPVSDRQRSEREREAKRSAEHGWTTACARQVHDRSGYWPAVWRQHATWHERPKQWFGTFNLWSGQRTASTEKAVIANA